MCIIWIIFNIIGRILYNKNIIQNSNRNFSVYQYYQNTCTHKHKSHLFWTWNSAYLYDYHPNLLMFLVLWAIPGLLTKKTFNIIIIGTISLFVSLFISFYILKEGYTFTSTWCYISVPIVLYMILLNYI